MPAGITTAPCSTRLCHACAHACRYNHCALFDERNNRLVVFGGRNAERKRLNDIHFLDLATFTWCV